MLVRNIDQCTLQKLRFYIVFIAKNHMFNIGAVVSGLEGQSLILLGKMGSVCFYHELNASNFLLARDVE